MEEEKKKSFLMFVTLQEFFSDILKRNSEGTPMFKLGDCFMLIVSRDITTRIGVRSRDYAEVNEFQSRYENVEFLTTLLPKASLMEFAATSGVGAFAEQYVEMLQAEAPMGDIISICDSVVNRGVPTFIIFTSGDKMTQFPDILQDYIKEEFGLIGYMVEDIADKPFETVYDIGDVEEIKKNIAEHIDLYLKQFDKEYFFNALTDDMERTYREILSQRTEEELRALAKERHVFVSRRYGKDEIIEKIISDIKVEGK